MANLSHTVDTERVGGRPASKAGVRPEEMPVGTKDDADGNALDGTALQINPEAMRGVPPLIGLDDVEVVVVQPAHAWARWTEGLLIHVVGAGVVAGTVLCVGLLLGSPTSGAGGGADSTQPDKGCVLAPVPTIKDRNG